MKPFLGQVPLRSRRMGIINSSDGMLNIQNFGPGVTRPGTVAASNIPPGCQSIKVVTNADGSQTQVCLDPVPTVSQPVTYPTPVPPGITQTTPLPGPVQGPTQVPVTTPTDPVSTPTVPVTTPTIPISTPTAPVSSPVQPVSAPVQPQYSGAQPVPISTSPQYSGAQPQQNCRTCPTCGGAGQLCGSSTQEGSRNPGATPFTPGASCPIINTSNSGPQAAANAYAANAAAQNCKTCPTCGGAGQICQPLPTAPLPSSGPMPLVNWASQLVNSR